MKVKDKWKRGLPYVGNKGQNVEQIMEVLPDGKRLVDIFGGGGCVSLTAASSGKYEKVIYNDRRKTVVELLRALVNDEPHFNLMDYVALTREQFFNWRDNQHDSIERRLVLIVYSFSNDQRTYLWSKKNEKEKLLLTRALFYGNTGTEFDQLYNYSSMFHSLAVCLCLETANEFMSPAKSLNLIKFLKPKPLVSESE